MFTIIVQAYMTTKVAQQKGTWIWDAPRIVEQGKETLAFAKQNDVTHIYLYIDNKVAPSDYARFIREARKDGIQVEALGGDPSWGRKEKRIFIQDFLEWVGSYNMNVKKEEQFSGIHLDIEPYLLPEWEKDQEQVVREWFSNMEYVAKETSLWESIHVSVDLPFWIDRVQVPGYEKYAASTWMLKRFDTVVLMDYRDAAKGNDGIISNALAVLHEATSMENKSVIVGVEMAKTTEGNHTSFYEEGHRKMNEELELSRDELKKFRAFKGVAIHGFSEWVRSYEQ